MINIPKGKRINKIKVTKAMIGKTIYFGNNMFCKILSVVDKWITYQSNNSGSYNTERKQYTPRVESLEWFEFQINYASPKVESIK